MRGLTPAEAFILSLPDGKRDITYDPRALESLVRDGRLVIRSNGPETIHVLETPEGRQALRIYRWIEAGGGLPPK